MMNYYTAVQTAFRKHNRVAVINLETGAEVDGYAVEEACYMGLVYGVEKPSKARCYVRRWNDGSQDHFAVIPEYELLLPPLVFIADTTEYPVKHNMQFEIDSLLKRRLPIWCDLQ